MVLGTPVSETGCTANTAWSLTLLKHVDHFAAGLPYLDDVAVRVPHVAPHLPAMVVERFCDKSGALALPLTIAGLDVGHSQI